MGRTPQEETRIQYRRKQVADLYKKDYTQVAIARELRVSQATISSDLKAIRLKWTESQVRDYDEARAEQLQTLAFIIQESLKAWERSQTPVETTRIVQKNGEKRAEKTIRQRSGDPQHLRTAVAAIDKTSKLLGLDETGRPAAARLDEEAIRDKVTLRIWDTMFAIDNGSQEPEVIDEA